eukprot:g6157.t1
MEASVLRGDVAHPAPCRLGVAGTAADSHTPCDLTLGHCRPGEGGQSYATASRLGHVDPVDQHNPGIMVGVFAVLGKHCCGMDQSNPGPTVAVCIWSLGALQVLEKKRIQKDVVLCNTVISSCEHSSQWPRALNQFASFQHSLLHASVVSFGAVMSNCEKADQWHMAGQLLSQLYSTELESNAILLASAMSASGGEAWRCTMALLQQKCDVICFNSAVSACGEAKRWASALKILLDGKCQQLRSTIVSYSAAMSASENQWLSAWHLFQLLRSDGVLVSTVPFNAVASACEKAAEWENALHLVIQVDLMRLQRSIITYGSGISACEKSLEEWGWSLHLLAELLTRSLQGNLVVHNAAISACEKRAPVDEPLNHLRKGAQWQHALRLLSTFNDRDLESDLMSFNALISSCEKAQQWQAALHLLRLIPLMRLQRSIITYSSAISACQKASGWERALLLVAELTAVQLPGNAIAYNAALTSCEMGSQSVQALLLLKRLEETQAAVVNIRRPGDAACATGVPRLLCSAQRSKDNAVESHGVEADDFAYAAALRTLGRCEDWRSAAALFATLPTAGGAAFSAEVRRNALLSAYEKSAVWLQALKLMAAVPALGDRFAISAASSTYADGHAWPAALQVAEGMEPDRVIYGTLLKACMVSLKWSKAVGLLQSMEEGSLPGDVTTCHAAISACTEPYCGGFWWSQSAPRVKLVDGDLGKKAAPKEAAPVDFPEVSFFPAFDPPLASFVKLRPANQGTFDRWNIPNAVTVKVGTRSEMKFLTNEARDAGLGEPEYVVRQGLQLVSWKPRHGRLHVTPFLGSKEESLGLL